MSQPMSQPMLQPMPQPMPQPMSQLMSQPMSQPMYLRYTTTCPTTAAPAPNNYSPMHQPGSTLPPTCIALLVAAASSSTSLTPSRPRRLSRGAVTGNLRDRRASRFTWNTCVCCVWYVLCVGACLCVVCVGACLCVVWGCMCVVWGCGAWCVGGERGVVKGVWGVWVGGCGGMWGVTYGASSA